MNHPTGTEFSLDQRLRAMQIIKFALIMGVTAFAGYVLVMNRRPAQPDTSPMVWVLAAFGGTTILARLFAPSLITRSGLQQVAAGTWQSANPSIPGPTTDEGRLAMIYQTQMIVGSALLEGGAFANLVSCMTTGHALSWILSGVMWLGLVIDFPTRLGVERWIEAKLAWLRDERNLQGRPH